MNQGKLDEAKNFLMKAIQIEPKYQDAHLNLALAYEKSNDWKSAYEWYKKSEPLIGDQDLKKQIAVRIVWMNEIIQGMRRSIAKENP